MEEQNHAIFFIMYVIKRFLKRRKTCKLLCIAYHAVLVILLYFTDITQYLVVNVRRIISNCPIENVVNISMTLGNLLLWDILYLKVIQALRYKVISSF